MRPCAFFLFILLAACQTIQADDPAATIAAGEALYGTESARVAATSAIRRTEVMATVYAAGTQIYEVENVNAQLYATLENVVTATSQMNVERVDPPADIMDDMVDRIESIVTTGITTSVSEANGCAINPQLSFSPSSLESLYATMQAFGVPAGSQLRAEWYRNETLVVADDWALPWDANNTCLWFIIDRADTDFAPGSWSARLYLNGVAIGQPMPFSIEE